MNKYPANFENGDFFSVFKKQGKKLPDVARRIRIVFARPHENSTDAKTPEVG